MGVSTVAPLSIVVTVDNSAALVTSPTSITGTVSTEMLAERAATNVNRRRARMIVNILRIMQKLTKRSPETARKLASCQPSVSLKKCQALKFLPAAAYYALKLLKQQVHCV